MQQVFSLFFHMRFRLQVVCACIYTVPIDIMLTQLAQSLSPEAYKVDRKVLGFVFWGKRARFVGVFFCQIAVISGSRFDTLAEVVLTGAPMHEWPSLAMFSPEKCSSFS